MMARPSLASPDGLKFCTAINHNTSRASHKFLYLLIEGQKIPFPDILGRGIVTRSNLIMMLYYQLHDDQFMIEHFDC